ncbi:MAG: hypothetical protein AAFQ82_24000 [Myxococcota bacterium]
MFPRVDGVKKKLQKPARVKRAFEHFEKWASENGVPIAESPIDAGEIDRDGASMAS